MRKDNMRKEIKKAIKKSLALLCVTTIAFTATLSMTSCGTSKENEVNEGSEEAKYSAQEIFDEIKKSITDLPQVEIIDEKSSDAEVILGNVTDIDLDKIKEFKYAYSNEGLADEILVITLKNSKDVKSVKADFENWIEIRRGTFNTYNAAEIAKINSSVVYTNGVHAVMVISKQGQNAKFKLKKMFE